MQHSNLDSQSCNLLHYKKCSDKTMKKHIDEYYKSLHQALFPPKVHETIMKIIRKQTGQIGGNSVNAPIYGELTASSYVNIIQLFLEVGMSESSIAVDIGSGLNKFGALIGQYCKILNVEIDKTRMRLALMNLFALARKQFYKTYTNNILLLSSVEDCTPAPRVDYIYAFDTGMCPTTLQHIGKWIDKCKYAVVFHKKEIYQTNVHMELMKTIHVSMFASSESKTAYLYRISNSCALDNSNIFNMALKTNLALITEDHQIDKLNHLFLKNDITGVIGQLIEMSSNNYKYSFSSKNPTQLQTRA